MILVALACAALVIIRHGIVTSQKSQERKIPEEKIRYIACLVKQKQYNTASIELSKIAAEYSDSVDVMGVYAWLCECYSRQGLETEAFCSARCAVAKGKELLGKHPNRHDLCCCIGSSYSTLGDWENARKSFQKFIDAEAVAKKKDPALRCRAYLEIAKAYRNQGKWSEAVQHYQKVLANRENPCRFFMAEAQFFIAEAYRVHGKEIFGTEEKAKEATLRAYNNVTALYPEKECAQWREKAKEQARELADKI